MLEDLQEIALLGVDFLRILTRFQMGPKQSAAQSDDLFKSRLDQLLNMNHPLIKLSGLMDWERIETTLVAHFVFERGRPTLPPRLVAGLLYLQHCFDCSDELVVNTWVENPLKGELGDALH
ncbi:hypothetical protein B9Z38_14835 [Limnohabitans sp. MMS-10A-160]|nr:hypothetical protein B9Z38_14835 [Limnohabitans sp. MMS-10A-160]